MASIVHVSHITCTEGTDVSSCGSNEHRGVHAQSYLKCFYLIIVKNKQKLVNTFVICYIINKAILFNYF